MRIFQHIIESPIGPITLAANEAGELTHLCMTRADLGEPDRSRFNEAARQIEAYFAGELTEFSLPLAPQGTPFQKKIWELLLTIPFGETRTYVQLAREIGKTNGSRAVGGANGANPIALIIPCHRVIGSNGSLTGFAYGTSIKKFLLDHECKDSGLFRE